MVQKSLEKLSPSMNFRQIAFGQAAARICSCATGNHIYFGYGGGTSVRKEMGPVLKASAKLLARFEDAKIHIDAHAGVKAPGRFVAKNCSQARAKAILRELVHFGVPANRITFVAWGKEISSHWKDTDEKVARAEIYFQMAGAEFPERPGYYLQAALSTSTALRHGPDEVYICLDAIHLPDKPDYYRNSPSLGTEPQAFHIYNRDGHFWLMPEEELEMSRFLAIDV